MQERQNFLQAMSAVTNTCDLFPKDDISKLFREFIVVLEEVFVTGVLNFDVSKLQNRKLIQFMISKEGSTKFKNVKVIIHIIISASVKISAESIVESLVSRYEHHFNSYRQLDEANANALNKMIISENGPALHDADTLLERAMHKYWLEKSVNGKWHFIRESDNIKLCWRVE